MRLIALALVAAGLATAAASGAAKPAKAPGQALVEAKCVTCHPMTMVSTKRKSQAEWEASLDNMIDRGMRASDAEFDLMTTYLTRTYGRR
jgi:cytochrome c5